MRKVLIGLVVVMGLVVAVLGCKEKEPEAPPAGGGEPVANEPAE